MAMVNFFWDSIHIRGLKKKKKKEDKVNEETYREEKRKFLSGEKKSTYYLIKNEEFLSLNFIISIILVFCKYISLVTQLSY